SHEVLGFDDTLGDQFVELLVGDHDLASNALNIVPGETRCIVAPSNLFISNGLDDGPVARIRHLDWRSQSVVIMIRPVGVISFTGKIKFGNRVAPDRHGTVAQVLDNDEPFAAL